MPVDVVVDDIAEADDRPPARFGGRGFWLVSAALSFACVFLLVEIFANFGTKDAIAHAEHTLGVAQAAADRVRTADGSYADADHLRLSAAEPSLAWIAGDEPSTGLDQVSVAVRGTDWGAAVQARPGACFYLHLAERGRVRYGVGSACTGSEALHANDIRW